MSNDAGTPTRAWDDVIVGAGSAGAVLASRLSECPDRRVLLLEAGDEQPEPAGPPRPLGHPVLTGANWDYIASLGTRADEGRRFPYPVGKVMGGSSAVNAAIALRGLPGDFDGWAAAGNPEWAWDQVRPYFTKLETDVDVRGSAHGADGPIPVRRPTSQEYDPMAVAFLRVCRARGLPVLADMNGDPGIGVGPVPSNSRHGRRVSTAEAYLAPARCRPNLTVRARCHVTRVLVTGGRAVGVEALVDGRAVRVCAGRIILSAGAINTPGILQRSGIGAAGRLAALGVDTVCDLPGVGENLSDHPAITFWALPRPQSGPCPGVRHAVMARLATSGADPDIGVFLATNVADVEVPVMGAALNGRVAAAVSAVLLAPVSRGRVYLRDTGLGRPVIVLRLASARPDVERLMRATRLAWSLVRSSPLAGLLHRVLVWTDRMVADDALLDSAIRRFVVPLWHPVGTARMGPVTDGMAVVDERCRVHSVSGLHVVDASVMPSIPRATPNLSCVMLAERVAEWMA